MCCIFTNKKVNLKELKSYFKQRKTNTGKFSVGIQYNSAIKSNFLISAYTKCQRSFPFDA